jgi:UDP-N-acetyl-D-mannosaminuronic acid transferase (WecB/TagA/CpsF family)
MTSKRIELMGCKVDNLSMEETLKTVEGFIASRISMSLSTLTSS